MDTGMIIRTEIDDSDGYKDTSARINYAHPSPLEQTASQGGTSQCGGSWNNTLGVLFTSTPRGGYVSMCISTRRERGER
jgi:hypothetical protein